MHHLDVDPLGQFTINARHMDDDFIGFKRGGRPFGRPPRGHVIAATAETYLSIHPRYHVYTSLYTLTLYSK